ncbi:MAG: small basic protein [Candidatus Omnitrophica bacterium]|nr:small basic protein [Candidatus Omnitrophota bacterium]
MSIHPSLASQDKSAKARSVLKRAERLKAMLEKNKWKEGDDVYGLPKMKTVRIKIKKEKAAKEAEATAAGAAAPAAGAAPEAQAATAKAQAAKKAEK